MALLVQKASGTNAVHFAVPTTAGNTIVLVICWQGPDNELLDQVGNEGKISAGGNIFARNGSQFVFNEVNPSNPSADTQNAIMNCPNVTAISDITTVATTPAWTTVHNRIMWAYEIQHMPITTATAALGSLDSSAFTQTPTTDLDINFFGTWFDEDDGVCKFDVVAVTSDVGVVTSVAGTWTLDTLIDARFASAYTESKNVNSDVPVFTSSAVTNYAANAESSFSLDADCSAPPPTGNIIVEKVTNPTGSSQSFDFTTDYGSPFSLLDGETNDSGAIAPGTYAVVEAPVASWTTTTSQDPSAIVLGAGDTITVTFTNTQAAAIIVQKVTDPSGSSQSFDFTTSYGSPFSLTDGTSNNSGDLTAGTYSVSETPVSGWNTSVATNPLGIDPTAIPLAPGDTVVVTFTNTQIVPPPPVPCGKVLTRVDTWELDNGDPTWAANDSVPIAWYDSNLEQQKVGITRPSQNGTIGLLYIQLAATLTGAGVSMTIPDDWTPYVLWGALADLLSHDGPAFDPLRAKYAEQRYQEGVELARLVLKGV